MSAPRQPVPPQGLAPAAPGLYRRSGLAETLRLAARALDFVLLVRRAARSGALPPLATLRRSVLLELGPGPTKLRFLKRLMFGRVHFLDWEPYGPAREDLTIMDLEGLRSLSSLSAVLGGKGGSSILLFADHCLEHLSRDTVDHVLALAERTGAACLVRVPNVLSPIGRANYGGDPTHRTPFDEAHRRALLEMGLRLTPHFRWYRFYRRGAARMDAAEEVVVAGSLVHPPPAAAPEHA